MQALPDRVEGRRFSNRERQALEHLRRGLTQKEAAYEMGIAFSTLRVLLYRAARKLGGRRDLFAPPPRCDVPVT